jgi:hypothetical protein
MTQCSRDYKDIRYVVLNPNNRRLTRHVQLVSPDEARVIKTKEAGLTAEDTCISLGRCWGQRRPTALLTTSEIEMKAGINTSILLQTFRNTIHTTWLHCVHCIWVNSLCILQDSAEVWQGKAAMMGDVYRFACLKIMATRASEHSRHVLYSKFRMVGSSARNRAVRRL